MDDDIGPIRRTRSIWIFAFLAGCTIASIYWGGFPPHPLGSSTVFAQAEDHAVSPGVTLSGAAVANEPGQGALDSLLLVSIFVAPLLVFSAFFSASEVAFFSMHKLRIRGMKEDGGFTARLASQMMDHPNRLLTTILVGNTIVNVLISVLLPSRMEAVLDRSMGIPAYAAYPATVILCTIILVFFGEIVPKVLAVRIGELYSRAAAVPLRFIDVLLSPIRWSVMRFTDFLFRVTRFNDIKAAPFITDEEFRSVLSQSNVQGLIEDEDAQMIQGILEFSDAQLREILVPRPDVVALRQEATVGEALELYRRHEYSRMPVYQEDLDHVTGVLFAKDLLSSVVAGELDKPIEALKRPARYMPITMTARGFVKEAQRTRMHLAIVVDEYGGTEGVVTLEDAIEEVVGEISEEEEKDRPAFEQLEPGKYRVDGNFPLDELGDRIGVRIEDVNHETVAGFLMEHTNKIPSPGDRFQHDGVEFIVEDIVGKRVSRVRIKVLDSSEGGKKV